jgi:hypothetical protein
VLALVLLVSHLLKLLLLVLGAAAVASICTLFALATEGNKPQIDEAVEAVARVQ